MVVEQEAAERVVKKAMGQNPSKTDLVYSKEKFVEEFASILDEGSQLSNADLDVLLLYLSRDSGAIAYDGKVCFLHCFLSIIGVFMANYGVDYQI